MAIIGTPIGAPGDTGVSGADQGVLTTPAFSLYGCQVGGRRRAAQCAQGTSPSIEWVMLDPQGRQVDLTSLGDFPAVPDENDDSRVSLKVAQSMLVGDSTPTREAEGVVTAAAAGEVTFALTEEFTRLPGVYLAEAAVYDASGVLVFTNQFYLVVNRGLHGQQLSTTGPPSVAEIRLHLRDSGAEDNPLLESVQFDLAEIALAVERPVLYWNESPPPIDVHFTTQTYPFRYYWLEGVVSQLYLMAAHFYRRNRLPYSAGGVQVDDLNKAQEYEQVGQQKWAEYKEWVRHRKIAINAEAAIQSQFSPYASRGYF